MIAAIADCLERAGLAFTVREIEDIVWLASLMDPAAREPGAAAPPAPAAEVAGPQAGEPDDDEETGLDLPPATAPADEDAGAATDPVRLFAPGTGGTVRGTTVHVPGVAGTGAPDQFRRALQPFARRVLSRRATQLDEEATAVHAAETGIWMPLFEPVRERCFDLHFVIEDCTSAELRQQALGELANIFQRYSGLRSVGCYRLGGTGVLRLTTLDGGVEYGVERLQRNDRRQLVLFATDGTSPRWRDGSAQQFLHALGTTTSVSLLHLLPRPAWRHTLTGEPDVELHSTLPGEPNRHFQVRLPWWIDLRTGELAMPMPVLDLEVAAAGAWARGINACGGACMAGILVMRPATPIPPTAPPDSMNVSPAMQVARYRNMVSEAAFRLAVFLSTTDPLTVPIMRLVQRTMLPDSGDGELAEFMLGGLVIRLPDDPAAGAERLYRFREGVSSELLKSLRYSEESRIDRKLLQVGRFLELGAGEARGFDVTFPAPGGTQRLGGWSMPFAEMSRKLLRQRGARMRIGAATPGNAQGRAGSHDRDEHGGLPVQPEARDPDMPGLEFFVGREQEMERLEAVLGGSGREMKPTAGRCLLTGPGGIGKTALAHAYARAWGRSRARGSGPIFIRLAPYEDPLPELLAALGTASVAESMSQLRAGARLLVVDGVDTVDLLGVARGLAERLANCSMLLVGRVSSSGEHIDAIRERGWHVMALAGLTTEESLRMLRHEVPVLAVPTRHLAEIADALSGVPFLLQMAMRHLAEPSAAARFTQAVQQAGSGSRTFPDETIPGLDTLLQHALDFRLNAWLGREPRHERWLVALLIMAHGPASGAPASLAAALAGMPEPDAGDPTRSEFADFCREAVEIGLMQDTGTLTMPAIVVQMLRQRATSAHRLLAERRWAAWIVQRLKARGKARQQAWGELNKAQDALREWLETCSVEAGSPARAHFLAYARTHGPMDVWRAFCRRMLDLLPPEGAARANWYYTSARLADADGDFAAALDDLALCERLLGRVRSQKGKVALAAARNMRAEITSRYGQMAASPGAPGRATGAVPEDRAKPTLRLQPHHLHLAEAALQATKTGGERIIGTVVQALGTGMSLTLMAYLDLCQQHDLGVMPYLVVVDRMEVARQIVHLHQEWAAIASLPPLIEPESLDGLRHALAWETPCIIVTSAQKLRLLEHAYHPRCMVICFDLHRSAFEYAQRLSNARLILFGHDGMLWQRFSRQDPGPIIAKYTREDAIRHGDLLRATVRSVDSPMFIGEKGRGLPIEAIEHAAGAIGHDLARAGLPFKAVLVIDDVRLLKELRVRLHSQPTGRKIRIMHAIVPSGFGHETIAAFNRNLDEDVLLIARTGTVRGLFLNGVDSCYVLAKVSPPIQLKLESFVNRPRPGRGPGDIVDFANNDWSALKDTSTSCE